MSDPLFWLLLALLAAVTIREAQHSKLTRQLIDKILLKQGIEPIPEPPSFVDKVMETITGGDDKRTPYNPEARAKAIEARQRATTTFQIPGMDVEKAMRAARDKQ